MIELSLLSYSFVQGILAFFAPCAVALLPGYLASFVTRAAGEKKNVLQTAMLLGCSTILGIILIYAVAGTLLFTIAQLVKQWIPWIVVGMGVLIIILGIMMLLGKNVSLPLHGPQLQSKNQYVEAFIFGIAYGLGALGCLFPLFLVVVAASLKAGFIGVSYIIAYGVGMSLFMLLFYILAVTAKEYLQKSLSKIMPHVMKIGGLAVIIAGIYIIWYQSALL
ncbi:MAG: hypothetical protein OXR66_01710 [Candidatus Woesearchaeota archaeon]|nr:hypothetical protein [Candidatus Woesearchaeota archaeon]